MFDVKQDEFMGIPRYTFTHKKTGKEIMILLSWDKIGVFYSHDMQPSKLHFEGDKMVQLEFNF